MSPHIRVRMEAWRQRQRTEVGTAMDITTEFGDGLTKRSGEEGGRKNRPAAARNLPPPFPGQRVYGTDPRRQGYVAGDILQKRENFSRHRVAPLTAPVPFRKTRCTSGKGGECKGAGSPANAGLDGQTIRPVRYGGSGRVGRRRAAMSHVGAVTFSV